MPVAFGADRRDTEVGKGDAQGRIVEAYAPFGGGAVERVAFIGEEGVVLEDDEPMGEPVGNVELEAIGRGELHGDMAPEGGGAPADVDGDVPDGAADDADKFGLRVRGGLPVEAADDTPGGEAFIVLREDRVRRGKSGAR